MKHLLIALFVLVIATTIVDAGTVTPAAAFTPPACTAAPFDDVPSTHPFCAWIKKLYEDGITAGCGNGNYCPEAPVTRAQMSVFLETAMRGTPAWDPASVIYTRRIIVNPVIGGTDLQNGEALRAALVEANDATSITGVVVQLEPGVFNLGSEPAVVPVYVTVEGAGVLLSRIKGAPESIESGVLELPFYTQLRHVSIEALSPGPAVVTTGYVVLDHVALSGNPAVFAPNDAPLQMYDSVAEASGTGTVRAIDVGTFTELRNVEVNATGVAATEVIAVHSRSGNLKAFNLRVHVVSNAPQTTFVRCDGTVELEQIVLTGAASTTIGNVRGVDLLYGDLRLSNARIDIRGATVVGLNAPAMTGSNGVFATDVRIDVRGSSSAVGMSLGGGNSEARNSRIVASAPTSSALDAYNLAEVKIANSRVAGQNAIVNSGLSVLVGATEVSGIVMGTGVTKCVHAFNEEYDALSTDCSAP